VATLSQKDPCGVEKGLGRSRNDEAAIDCSVVRSSAVDAFAAGQLARRSWRITGFPLGSAARQMLGERWRLWRAGGLDAERPDRRH
jgi:hypothetical protein